jgi:GNAT superfamily N-acetyltransferase
MTSELRVEPGSAHDGSALLALFDDAVAWLTARGQPGQWGTEPFSARPERVNRAEGWARGGGLWFATAGAERAGAVVLGEAPDHVPPPDRPELYVEVLLTAAAWRGRGVGALLIAHAREVAAARRAEQLRVDCWAGVPELPRQYERLGFRRAGEFRVGAWPGAVLVQDVNGTGR